MLKFLADENFHRLIVRQIQELVPEADIQIAQETEIYGQDDPTVLDYAARENRILLTHDARTIPYYAYERIQRGLHMPGIILVKGGKQISEAVDQIKAAVLFGYAQEYEDQVRYLPIYDLS